MSCKNTCTQCNCTAPKKGYILTQIADEKSTICRIKKQYDALKKQEQRREDVRLHNIEALKEYIRNAKFIAALGLVFLLIPAWFCYALWAGFSAFNIAVAACIFAGIFAILLAIVSSYRAKDLQLFSDILERMGSNVDEDLHDF